MNWTKEKPSTFGYYWNRFNNNPATQVIVRLDYGEDGLMYQYFKTADTGPELSNLFDLEDTEWAGPIPEPEDI